MAKDVSLQLTPTTRPVGEKREDAHARYAREATLAMLHDQLTQRKWIYRSTRRSR